jgi:hypothetical protein
LENIHISSNYEGIEIKKVNPLMLISILIASSALTLLVVGYEPVALSGYKPTFIPNPNYNPTYSHNSNYNSLSPIQIGTFYSSESVQLNSSQDNQPSAFGPLSASSSEQIQEIFRVVGDSYQPIPDAQVVGSDGSGNIFQEFTDSNGYAAINGTPGNWRFTVYSREYFSKTLNRKFEYNTQETLVLQKIGVQEELSIAMHAKKFPIKINNETCELNKEYNQGSEMDIDNPSEMDGMG